MAQIRVAASADVDAPPQKVYAILADYQNEHPQILPDRHFSDFTVERGGKGAGTLIRFQMHVLGQSRTIRAEVSEPEPGRVLAETDLDTGAVTRFTVEPTDGGQAASVTIVTEWNRSGIMGFVERLTAPPLLRRIYDEELRNLAKRARSAA